MSGAYDGEMAVVEGGDLGDTESLGRSHHRGVDRSKWQVPIAPDEFSDTKPVLAGHRLTDQIAGGEVPEEPDFGLNTKPAGQQVCHLGHNKYWDDKRTGMRFEELESFHVAVVVGVDVGI